MNIKRALDIQHVVEKKSCFLLGPRQSGKSWLIRHVLPKAITFDLLSSEVFLQMTRHPGYLGEVCKRGDVVVMDEIQKAPMLLDEVHRLIEEKGVRFLLTGSSARKLRRGGVNLLGGRARTRHLHPFSAHELGDQFRLTHALNIGLLPGIYFSESPLEDLRSYVGLYLQEEIAAEGAARNIPAFSRFLEVAALCNGQQINYSRIANDAQVARTTVQEYMAILKDTLLATEVPVWKKTSKRKTVETAKFYFFDAGIVRILQGRGEAGGASPDFGRAFEHWIFHELWCYNDVRASGGEISCWRTPDGIEVDFVFNGETAIEVKSSAHVAPADLKGLHALAEEKLLKRYIVVSREPRRRKVGNILILPWQEFLVSLWNGDLG